MKANFDQSIRWRMKLGFNHDHQINPTNKSNKNLDSRNVGPIIKSSLNEEGLISSDEMHVNGKIMQQRLVM